MHILKIGFNFHAYLKLFIILTVRVVLDLTDLGIPWKRRPGHRCLSCINSTSYGTLLPVSTIYLEQAHINEGRALWLFRYCILNGPFLTIIFCTFWCFLAYWVKPKSKIKLNINWTMMLALFLFQTRLLTILKRTQIRYGQPFFKSQISWHNVS